MERRGKLRGMSQVGGRTAGRSATWGVCARRILRFSGFIFMEASDNVKMGSISS